MIVYIFYPIAVKVMIWAMAVGFNNAESSKITPKFSLILVSEFLFKCRKTDLRPITPKFFECKLLSIVLPKESKSN